MTPQEFENGIREMVSCLLPEDVRTDREIVEGYTQTFLTAFNEQNKKLIEMNTSLSGDERRAQRENAELKKQLQEANAPQEVEIVFGNHLRAKLLIENGRVAIKLAIPIVSKRWTYRSLLVGVGIGLIAGFVVAVALI